MAGMIVPQYWGEARARGRAKGRQVTVRRWGWSDESADLAQAHADVRAKDALERILGGEDLPRRETRVAYNGADGVPIREEIVSRHGDTVITRNGYGALCLNTPDVLFADVDFGGEPRTPCGLLIAVPLLAALAAGLLVSWHRGMVIVAVLLGSGALVSAGWKWAQRLKTSRAGGPEAQARERIVRFLKTRPEWNVRVYRTPAGFRVLVLHRRFDPRSAEAGEFFDALASDPLYVRMCTRQYCFRARVSPKPWRIGIDTHLRPRPGVWPIRPARLPDRKQWVAAYDAAARGYASCRYQESFGRGPEDPGAAEVRALHDDLSRALTSLPIA